MSWLDKFFTGGYKNIASAGSLLPQETTLNFVSGATVVDNPSTGMTNVTITTSVTPGAAGQGYFTNASLAAVWATYSQDVTMSSSSVGQATVSGLLTKALPSLPVAQQFLGYSGSAWNFTSATGISALTTYGGDISSTSTATAQYIQSLSYSSASTGGAIAVNGTGSSIVWASNNTGPVETQAQVAGTGSTAGVAYTITAQQGQNASGGTNNAGGNLVLQSGAPGTGGTGGNAGQVQFYCGSTQVLAIDNTTFAGYTHFTNTGSTNGYYFNNTGPNFYVVSSNIFFDGILQIQDPGNGDKVWNWTATYNANAAMSVGSTCTGVSISQDQLAGTGSTVGSSMTIQAQQGQNVSGGTNNNGGAITIAGGIVGTGGTGGTAGPIHFAIAGANLMSINASGLFPNTDLGASNGLVSFRWLAVNSGPNGHAVYHSAGDANPSARLGDGLVVMGAGGASATDLSLTRSAASTLTISNTSNGNATLIVGGTSSANEIIITSSTTSVDTASTGTRTLNLGTTNATAVHVGTSSISFTSYGEGAILSSSAGLLSSLAVPVSSGSYALTYTQGSDTFAWTNTSGFGGGTSTGLTVAFRNLWVTR